jgi:hypothetical protein
MGMDAKHIGLIVAEGMPPPGALHKAMMGKGGGSGSPSDEGESDAEAQGETDSGESGGGADAMASMYKAWKAGDNASAWDAFCDAVDIAKARTKGDASAG